VIIAQISALSKLFRQKPRVSCVFWSFSFSGVELSVKLRLKYTKTDLFIYIRELFGKGKETAVANAIAGSP
jgi:hypothetical protein